MPWKICWDKVVRKLAGTETRPLRSTLFTIVERKSPIPHVRLAEMCPLSPEPPYRDAHFALRRLSVGSYGITWVNMGVNGID
uniref:Uncharacterized protein n=1 Tax=Magnetospirillum gryphiswaldense TaxID=55518 RepID=A4TVH2_9PROT|nr:hypothetical protein MGR_0064 [Magnetospirillum gryphiswaldense MSR-1]